MSVVKGNGMGQREKEKRRIFLAHLSRHNNTPDIARETVSEITGIKRYQIDCLECKGDTRIMHD